MGLTGELPMQTQREAGIETDAEQPPSLATLDRVPRVVSLFDGCQKATGQWLD